MKKTNFKLFTMFLAGILFSSIAVFAATISVSTNFGSAIQYLQKLVIKDYSNNQEKVTLDKNGIQITGNLVVDGNINGTNITGMNVNGENISGINITGTSINGTHINGTNINGEIVIGKTGKFEKYCDENGDNCKEISDMGGGGGESLWTSGDDKIYYQSGKVGIGTNITNNTLSVSGSANIGSVNLFTKMQGNYPTASIAGQWKLHLGGNANNIDMGSGMTIDSGGIVRILSKGSNWSPNKYHLFNVDGNAQIRSGLYVGEFFSNDRPASINFQFSGYNFQNKDGSTTWIKITNTGNVGIGTNPPEEKLHVDGTGKFGDRLYFSSFGTIGSYITASGTKPLNFIVNGINTMTMNSQGYVGIGTGTPQSMLHVNGTIQAGNNLKLSSNTNDSILASDRHLIFRTNETEEKMRIDNNGNVGIGTNTPTQKFQVSNFAQIGSNVSCAENPSSGGYFLRLFVTEGANSNCGPGSQLSKNTKVNIQLNNYGIRDDNWKIQNDKSFMSFGYATGSLVYENIFMINKDDSIQLQATTKGACNSSSRGKIKIIDGSETPFGDRLCFCGNAGQNDYRWLLPDGTLCNN